VRAFFEGGGVAPDRLCASVYSTAASFDANRIKWCPFSERSFSYFPTSDALFDSRNGLSDALLFLGEIAANMLWVQTGGAPDASTGGVEPSLSGPVTECIIWCPTGHHFMPDCGSIDTRSDVAVFRSPVIVLAPAVHLSWTKRHFVDDGPRYELLCGAYPHHCRDET